MPSCKEYAAYAIASTIIFAIFFGYLFNQKEDTDVKSTLEPDKKCTSFHTSVYCVPLSDYLALNRDIYHNVKDPKNKISLHQSVCNITTFPPLTEEEDRLIAIKLSKEVNMRNRVWAEKHGSHPPSERMSPGTADCSDQPHVGLLRYKIKINKTFDICPCVILNDNTILTAYTCLKGRGLKKLYVLVGNVDRLANETSNYEYKLINSSHHPSFDPKMPVLDGWILHTDKRIKFSSCVLPIDLPMERYYPMHAMACGWGEDTNLKERFDILQKVILTFVSPVQCSELFNDRDDDDNTLQSDYVNPLDLSLHQRYHPRYHMCYWDPTGANATTEVDYGGPLQYVNVTSSTRRYVLIGLTQPGVSDRPLLPGLFLDIYEILPWIVKTAWPRRFQELVDSYRLEQLAAAC